MLALILAAAFVMPEFRVDVGKTIDVVIEGPGDYWYGGHLSAEDPGVAMIDGSIPPRQRKAETRITGRRRGETQIMVSYLSGMSVYRHAIARVIVDEPCVTPAVTPSETHVRVREGEPVSLTAMTAGTGPFRIEWRQGDTLLGVGPGIWLRDLPRGVHRITVHAESRWCGIATAEVEITVYGMRRRSVRR